MLVVGGDAEVVELGRGGERDSDSASQDLHVLSNSPEAPGVLRLVGLLPPPSGSDRSISKFVHRCSLQLELVVRGTGNGVPLQVDLELSVTLAQSQTPLACPCFPLPPAPCPPSPSGSSLSLYLMLPSGSSFSSTSCSLIPGCPSQRQRAGLWGSE